MNPKSKIQYGLTLAAVLAATASIHAAPVIYESFSQATDVSNDLTGKAGGTGLSGNWSASSNTVDILNPPTLIYGALQRDGGQVNLPNNAGIYASIAPNTDLVTAGLLNDGATLWFSYVFQKTANGGSNEQSGFAFGTDRVNPAYNGLNMQNSGYGFGVFTNSSSVVASSWTGGTRTGGGGVGLQALSTPTLVIGKIVWGATGVDDETLTLYTRALTDIATEPTTGGGVRAVAAFDQTALNTISFGQRNSSGTHTYDEIRFGATYADVAPADTTAPLLLATTPADDGTAVVPTLQATFDDQMAAGTGNISIVNDTDTVTTAIDVTDINQVTFSGNGMTINPTTALIPGKSYHVEIPSGVLLNSAGIAYAGIADSTTWNFTVDGAPPAVVTVDPSDNATDVPASRSMKVDFDEVLAFGTGNITINNITDTTFTTIDVTAGTEAFIDPVDNTILVIDPLTPLTPGKQYSIVIDAGAITDLVGNSYDGSMPGDGTWSFTTRAPFTLDASDPLVPAGLGNGDTFQLIYVTSISPQFSRDSGGGSDDFKIYHWDDVVNSVADGSSHPDSAAVIAGLEWSAVVSVDNETDALPGVAARDHAVVSAPVYRIDGAQVATGYADIWDGTIAAPIRINQNGGDDVAAGSSSSNELAWSGTNSDGTISNDPLGNGTATASTGHNQLTAATWIKTADSLRRGVTNTDRFYALSEVITVTGAAASSYDTWATSFLPADVTDPAGDNDSDGLSNLLEFAFGTDPTVSDPGPLVAGAPVTPGSPVVTVEFPGGGGVDFKALFMRRQDHGTSGSAAYAWQFSSDLSDWESSDDAPAPSWFLAPTDIGDDASGAYDLMEVAYPFFLDNGKKARFFRVVVTLVP